MSEVDDAALLRRARKGHESAFGELYARYQRRIFQRTRVMPNKLWFVLLFLVLHLGIGIGVLATKWLTPERDSVACLSLEELRRTPRLEWQQ